MSLLRAGGRLRIIIALLVFSVIIIFHELGHFLLAKRGRGDRHGVFTWHGATSSEFSGGRYAILMEAASILEDPA